MVGMGWPSAGTTLENLLLTCQPEVPAPGKWTKLGSILSFLVLGFNCCNCLGRTYQKSIEAMNLQQKTDSEKVDDEIDPALKSDLHWSAVNGKRAKNGITLTSSTVVQFHVLVLAIMQEVTRYLTHWHLEAGSRQNKHSCRAPPLLDVANPKFSPYVMALQYLASLLTGAGRVLLTCPAFYNVDDWERSRPDEVRILRRICMYVSGWIYRRHLKFAEEHPVSTCVSCHRLAGKSRSVSKRDSWLNSLILDSCKQSCCITTTCNFFMLMYCTAPLPLVHGPR